MNRKKILIADDDPDILEQVSLLLQGEGYQVLSAHSQEGPCCGRSPATK